MKNNVLKQYIVALYFCSTFVSFAQPGDGNDTGNLEGTDTPMPIDDYLWVLVLVGLVFVFLKFRAIQKKENERLRNNTTKIF